MELDLSKEYKNIEDGQIYNGKYGDVVSEKVSDIIPPTPNSLMIEEAPGKTLDDILLDSAKMRDEVYKSVHESYLNQYGEIEYRTIIDINEETIKSTKDARDKLITQANDLIKKRDIMANITKVWIEEALFGTGYYHADLHAGNLLLSESTGTLIDFGNAVKFTDEQKASITKMMTAAASSRTEMFFEEFNKLLDWNDENFKAFYTEEVQRKVKATFEEILDMGEPEQAGERISAALIKASELGVKLPPSIYNFSQGQLRLQKSINDINIEIQKIDNQILDMDKSMRDFGRKCVGLAVVIENAAMASKNDRKAFAHSIKQQRDALLGIDKKTFIDGLLDNTYVKGDRAKGVATINKRADFDKNILGELENFESKIRNCYDDNPMPEDFTIYRQRWNAFKNKWTTEINKVKEDKSLNEKEKEDKIKDLQSQQEVDGLTHIGDFYPDRGDKDILMTLGFATMAANLTDAMKNLDDERIKPLLDLYEKQMGVGIQIDRKIKELRKLQDEGNLGDKKKETLSNEIYELFIKYNDAKNKNNAISTAFRSDINYIGSYDKHKEQLQMMFDEPTLITVEENNKKVEKPIGKLFEAKLAEYYEIAKKYAPTNNKWKMDNMPKEDETKAKELLEEMTKLHLDITKLQLQRFYEGRFVNDIEVKSFDFCDVMKVIIQKNFGKFTSNVGIGNLIKIGGIALLNKLMGKG